MGKEYQELLTKTAKLEAALEDMLRLVMEHGGPIMKAHATRIDDAKVALI